MFVDRNNKHMNDVKSIESFNPTACAFSSLFTTAPNDRLTTLGAIRSAKDNALRSLISRNEIGRKWELWVKRDGVIAKAFSFKIGRVH
jgi:hypothetical protein